MDKKIVVVASSVVALLLLTMWMPLGAQQPGYRTPKPAKRTPPATPIAAAADDRESVLFNWMWYMGMLRGVSETESVATLELRKSSGTIRVDGQPCKLVSYRASINYQIPGMRAQYSCTKPNGQAYKAIEVVSGQSAWNEDVVGAGLVPGRGTPTPLPALATERLIRIWAGPQGAAKAAAAGGAATKVAVEGGKPVVTFPIPGVPSATGKATLNSDNMAERVEVRHGTSLTEFTYSNYADWNPPDDKVDGYFAGHIVEKHDGVMVLDITVGETHVGNLYVVMPVPESVKKASVTQSR